MKIKCLDCQITLKNYKAKRCHSCEMKRRHKLGILNSKGKNNPNYDNHKLRGRIGISRFGKDNPNYKNGFYMNNRYCIDCDSKITRSSRGRCRKCSSKVHSKRMTGKNNPFYGKSPLYKIFYYKNIPMRSSWEVAYAKWLDKNNIKWLYESKTFDLGYTSYTPDFYLPETDEYIEIKGYLFEHSRKKYLIFNKLYKNIKLTILRKNDLIKSNILAIVGVINNAYS